jgi:serine phosphatase RsbU (regulator of sigma subunit)
LSRLNGQHTENGVLGIYITFLLAMLDVSSHHLNIVDAGHPCPLIRHESGKINLCGLSDWEALLMSGVLSKKI